MKTSLGALTCLTGYSGWGVDVHTRVMSPQASHIRLQGKLSGSHSVLQPIVIRMGHTLHPYTLEKKGHLSRAVLMVSESV